MELTEKDIKSYNQMSQNWYGRDATLDEMHEMKRTIHGLCEIIYEMYVRDKKSGKLEEIMKEIESNK